MSGMTFKGWLYWLTRLGCFRKLWKEDVKLDPQSWKVYYDEGLTAREALNEDLKHA